MDRELACIVCGGQARRYINFYWCDEHHPNLPPVPDPERTADYLAANRKQSKPYHKYGSGGGIYKRSKWL